MSASRIDWPKSYASPQDLAAIEEVPLSERRLPGTTYELLREGAGTWPDRVALSVLPDGAHWDQPVDRTFAQLLADVHGFANALRASGIRRGDAVALISPNCSGLITATLAAQLAGTAAPVNGALSVGHVQHLVELSGARVLVTAGPDLDLDGQTWQTSRELAAAGLVDTIVVLGPTGAAGGSVPELDISGVEVVGSKDFVLGASVERFEGDPPGASELAALFHTGGTTGLPKLAAHTHRNEVSDAWMIAASTTLADRDTVLAALPLFHVNALIITLLAPLMRGQRSLWAGPLGYRDPDLMRDFWRVVAHHGVNSMSAVPTVYSALSRVPVDADVGGLRFAIVGASALAPGTRAAFETATGIPLVEGYGLTEATCASARAFEGLTPSGAVGQRLAYQKLKAVRIDETGTWHELPQGTVGSVAIAGPTVFPGYVAGRDKDGFVLDGLGKLRDGWVDTGDLGYVDADDFLHLTGRAKDLIIRGGHNIDPRMIEDALLEHPHVTAAGAVGRPDPHAGEVPVAYVTLGQATSEHELLAWAADHVNERAAAPKSIHVVDALPVTAVGKPSKLELRADAARRAVTEALDGLIRPEHVVSEVQDGSVVVTLTLPPAVDRTVVQECLGHFAIPWRITSSQAADGSL